MNGSRFITLEDAKDPGWPWTTVKFRREMSFHARQFSTRYQTGRIVGGPWGVLSTFPGDPYIPVCFHL